MDSGNSKTFNSYRVLLYLTDKINLKKSDKYIDLSNLSMYFTWRNIKKSNKNSAIKITGQTRNEIFDLPDESYSVSDIQDHFEHLMKKHQILINDPPLRIYVSKIENKTTLRTKTEQYLKLLTPKTMKLIGSAISKVTQDENGENLPHLEIIEVVLAHCNVVNNDYSRNLRVLNIFASIKSFGQLLLVGNKVTWCISI